MGTKNSTSLLVHYKMCLACEGTGDSKPDWLVDRPSRNNCEHCRGFGYTLQGNRSKFRQALTDLAKNVCPHCDAALAEVETLRGELADCQRQANNVVASLDEACDEVERLRAALRLAAQEAMNR